MNSQAERLAQILSGDRSWETSASWDACELAEAAIEHGVGPLVWSALGETGGEAHLRSLLAHDARAAATRDLFIQRDMQATLAALSAAGIPALVIKGSALAYTLYPEPWLRPRIDTDLLVSIDNVSSAACVLEQRGYSRSDALSTGTLVSHQIAFERLDANGVHHIVDLHWKIVNPQVLADTLPFHELWGDARPAPALGPAARVPSDIASAALACIHRLAHHQGHDRLIWLYDLRLLTTRFDTNAWTALQHLARTKGIAGLCLDGLRETADLFGTAIPTEVTSELGRSAPREASSKQYLHGQVQKRDVLLSDLKHLRGWDARLRLVREHVFPPAAFIRQRYGVRSSWLLPALYLHRLVTGTYRWVRP